ncbi:3-oxoacyl-ACP synthase III family protein [Goodfellowiella coeruleoviolacea]|uniref:3-oxoacyl-[acyl-carrier-protein] synthase III n=1 Tax=Goodfellowiella coeruleoviolacea TaxID=334858 RepID=A0AAE3GM54_9PSEU|nr:ketoacyl-ACP synthase III [Goodfellowiella coeruleoviolacea]MCP2168523.1 3-oxoacyl-[acyl-carrier-protein] synthase III (EC 2.3.1.41) [Goodfellowiella coeruleoviolacea]
MTTQSVGILGTGSYVPAQEITNEDLAPGLGVTPEWIVRKTQIETRRYAAPHEATSDLAIRAAVEALDQAGLTADQLDYLIVPSTTGDAPLPPTSCLVQAALGARRAACFDINIACSGFVYGLAIAQGLVAARPGAHALVVAADVWSRFIDPTDRATTVLLADAAGAAVVGPVPSGYGIVETDLLGHGDQAPLLVIEAGGSRRPASERTVAEVGHVLRMRGREVTEFVLGNVPPSIKEVLARAGVRPDEVTHFVPHQANGVLLGKLAEQSGLDNAVTHRTIERYGNSGCASLPVTLDDANRAGALGDGDLVLLAGFGGGMAVGTCLLRWCPTGGTATR